MLKFSDGVWRNFLNPTSNLNRFRLGDYQRVFEAYFQTMEMVVLGHDLGAFRAARRAIRAEFLTGDEDMDAVTLISVFARQPK
jgi:hypothetical protein